MTTWRYIFIIIVLCFVLLAVTYLRQSQNCAFYRFRLAQAAGARLKQQLWQKQLRLEFLINPESVWKAVEKADDDN